MQISSCRERTAPPRITVTIDTIQFQLAVVASFLMAFASVASWPFRSTLPLQIGDFEQLAFKAFLASEPFTNAVIIAIRIDALLQVATALTSSILESNLFHPKALR